MSNSKTELPKEKEPTWIENKHGVKSCWPFSVAKKYIETKIGYKYAEADEVPEQKQYPVTGELTEQGYKNRDAINQQRDKAEKAKVEKVENVANLSEDSDMKLIRKVAKSFKLKTARKGKVDLIKEIKEAKKEAGL